MRTLSYVELVDLAGRIIRLEARGAELDTQVANFRAAMTDPAVIDLVFWSDAPITPEELVDRGLHPEKYN